MKRFAIDIQEGSVGAKRSVRVLRALAKKGSKDFNSYMKKTDYQKKKGLDRRFDLKYQNAIKLEKMGNESRRTIRSGKHRLIDEWNGIKNKTGKEGRAYVARRMMKTALYDSHPTKQFMLPKKRPLQNRIPKVRVKGH